MSQVVWRRDFIKIPASRLPGWPVGEAGEGGAHHMGEGRQCLALIGLAEMGLGTGGRGPFWVWRLMDGKREGGQSSTAKTELVPQNMEVGEGRA